MIAGSGGLIFSGSGTATLAAANSYTGGTTVSGGTVNATAAGALGATTGSLTISGGVLDLGGMTQTQNGGVTLVNGTIQNGTLSSTGTLGLQSGTVSAVLAGSGGLSKTTDGLAGLSAANTYTGATTISAGTLALGGAGSISNSSAVLVGTGGTFDISQVTGFPDTGFPLPLPGTGSTITTLADVPGQPANGTVTLGSNTLMIANGSTTFSGSIKDGGIGSGVGGNLFVAGGTQTLAGANNSYTGSTFVLGTLALSGAGSISSSAGVYVGFGGTLDISQTTNGATLQSLISQVGETNATGTIALGSKTLTISNASGEFDGTIKDGGIGGGTGGGLTIVAGELDANGTLSYTGTTTIDTAAKLVIDGGFSNGPYVVDGTLDLSADGSPGISLVISSLSGSGTVLLGSGTLLASSTSGFDGSLQNGGNSGGTDAGVDVPAGQLLQLRGQSVFSGSSTIESGATLRIAGSGSLADCFSGVCPTPNQYSGAIQIGSGATFEYSSSAAQTLAGVISGPGSLVKDVSSSTLTSHWRK